MFARIVLGNDLSVAFIGFLYVNPLRQPTRSIFIGRNICKSDKDNVVATW